MPRLGNRYGQQKPRRGRPPGVKNKPKPESVNAEPEETVEESDSREQLDGLLSRFEKTLAAITTEDVKRMQAMVAPLVSEIYGSLPRTPIVDPPRVPPIAYNASQLRDMVEAHAIAMDLAEGDKSIAERTAVLLDEFLCFVEGRDVSPESPKPGTKTAPTPAEEPDEL